MVATQRSEQARSRDTQRKILDAALDTLVGEGYSGATTLRIQKAAGVSRGALLHHFPSRDDLLVAAVHHLAADSMRRQVVRSDLPEQSAERIDAAVEGMWANYSQPYFWASMELWLAARNHPGLREALVPLEKTVGSLIRTATDNFFGPPLTARSRYPDLRELLHTSMRGVAMTYAIDPRDPTTDPHLPQWIAWSYDHLLD
ncbi:TetR/AcrR family transcriptional regulator [Jongsikchunia kroppenstedtii]|uniref:TetR/AcrR family transcriptional regulator n=1 Tax=Jongsikchunia kroppenstedtii TaxID=1121721 RepID=UPI000373BC78|nr:TetR/AcrR family transcriptional regulator [Jongsikchunia kroppenstedtii]